MEVAEELGKSGITTQKSGPFIFTEFLFSLHSFSTVILSVLSSLHDVLHFAYASFLPLIAFLPTHIHSN